MGFSPNADRFQLDQLAGYDEIRTGCIRNTVGHHTRYAYGNNQSAATVKARFASKHQAIEISGSIRKVKAEFFRARFRR